MDALAPGGIFRSLSSVLQIVQTLSTIFLVATLYYDELVMSTMLRSRWEGRERRIFPGPWWLDLRDRLLFSLRWGSAVAAGSGWLYTATIIARRGVGTPEQLLPPSGWWGFVATIFTRVVFANVWLVVWPSHRVSVLRARDKRAEGGWAVPEAAARGARPLWARRTNLMFTGPTLYFLFAGLFLRPPEPQFRMLAIVVVSLMVAIFEVNALVGPSVPGREPAVKRWLASAARAFVVGMIVTLLLAAFFFAIRGRCAGDLTMCIAGVELCCRDGRELGGCIGFWQCR